MPENEIRLFSEWTKYSMIYLFEFLDCSILLNIKEFYKLATFRVPPAHFIIVCLGIPGIICRNFYSMFPSLFLLSDTVPYIVRRIRCKGTVVNCNNLRNPVTFSRSPRVPHHPGREPLV